MRVGLDKDEWYPVFSLHEDITSYMNPVEVPDELFKRARRVQKAWEAVQDELGKLDR